MPPIICLAAACAALLFSARAHSQSDNVLILLADDLGVDNVTCYQEGATPPPTPNIDALAARGVLFRNAWADTVCSPSRACIMTGRHSFRTGVGYAIGPPGSATGDLRTSEVTLPEALDLGSSGYAHAAIGKWHLGRAANAPNVAGWSHFAGLLIGLTPDYYNWPRTVNGVTNQSTTYATTQIVDDALLWINAQTGPWVCYVAFNAPHFPFHVPPPSLHTRNLSEVGTPTTNPRPYFEAMVEAMDTEIGRLLSGLGPALNQTNIIFMGDNGSHEATILPPFISCNGKGTPYEGGANVPLIFAGPAVSNGGREVQALVSAVDLFSTVTELAGVDARSVVPPWVALDSVSMVPYLTNAAQKPLRVTVFAEQFWSGSSYAAITQTGHATMRNTRYKLSRFYSTYWSHAGLPPSPCSPLGPFPFEEFYDLGLDPFETNNLLLRTLSPEEQKNYLSITNRMAELRQPEGALHEFGTASCAGSNGNPFIRGSAPTVGATYSLAVYDAAPSSVALLQVGSSNTSSQYGPLPLDLSQLGAGTGCLLYTSAETKVPTTTNGQGFGTVSLGVPAVMSLVGTTVFHSWLIADPEAPGNTLGITTSDGVAAVIGI